MLSEGERCAGRHDAQVGQLAHVAGERAARAGGGGARPRRAAATCAAARRRARAAAPGAARAGQAAR